MLDLCLALCSSLNAMAEGRLTAPDAEALVRRGTAHHVHDPDQLLGLDPLAQVPLRLALARLAHGGRPAAGPGGAIGSAPPVWALLIPRPGRMAGLRGPLQANRLALEAGAVVTTHDGSLAWFGQQVGEGVQWRLARLERPLPPPDPREAARSLTRLVGQGAQALAELGVVAGQRPDAIHAPVLGAHYPERSQLLLDRAWLLLAASEQALAAQSEVLHSHAVLVREKHLRELLEVALDAVSAAASWPQRSLH
ncbi:hypothetical protein [Luteococcus peritonei]|uniref:Acyl-CoA dehydrogenase n=1 Tax=Luteococcus peritonei TaxID=88874 RepID=A0ABW4RTV0_9ACTN